MKLLALAILLLTLPLTTHAEDFGHPTMKTFTAKVSNTRLAANIRKKPDDMVSVKARAIIFPKDVKIADVRKAKNYNQPAVDTYIRYTRACMNGSVDELAKFWVKSERKEMKADLATPPEMLRMTHEHFRKNPGITIVGLVFKGNQTIILTRENFGGTEAVLGVTLATEDGGTFLTNRLSDDLDLSIIEASFLPAQ